MQDKGILGSGPGIGQKLLLLGIRLGLGGVFIYASFHKILAPDQFAKVLFGYGIFPGESINILAITVPFVELVAGICLVAGLWRRPALILINAMLTAFILIIAFNLIRGHEFDCGCFAFGEGAAASSATALLIRDIIMLVGGLILWRSFRRSAR